MIESFKIHITQLTWYDMNNKDSCNEWHAVHGSITPEIIIIKLNNKNISNNMSPGAFCPNFCRIQHVVHSFQIFYMTATPGWPAICAVHKTYCMSLTSASISSINQPDVVWYLNNILLQYNAQSPSASCRIHIECNVTKYSS